MSESAPGPSRPDSERPDSERKNPEAILRRLEWTVIRRLDGYLQGDYRTLFRGFGLDLADIREYQLHDDVRHIDWNVTARMQVPYVRQYNEDREITAWFLLDLSPSMDFGSEGHTKRDVLTTFTATVARLLTRHGNRVGAIVYGGNVDTIIPAATGRRHVLHIVNELVARPELKASPPTDLSELLRAALNVVHSRSFVFLVSDFVSAPGWDGPLNMLSQRHEILAVRPFDPLEVEIPPLGLFVMQDSETGEQVFVDTADRGFRKRFAQAAEQREVLVRDGLNRAGVDTLEMSTQDDIVDSILRFADLRKRRFRGKFAGAPAHIGTAQ
jgi:uncharacterized protein (DUF58 family)